MNDPPKSLPLTVRILSDELAWDGIEAQWNELFEGSSNASTPLRFSWLRSWWRHYGASYGVQGRGLQIVTVWKGAALVAALPLYQSKLHVSFLGVRRLGFLSTGESVFEETCPDYMNLLCLPGEEAGALRSIQETFQKMNWDFLELVNIPGGSPLLADQSWCRGPWEIVSTEGCPVSNLEGGFEKFLSRLNSKHRKNARRVLRAAAESAAVLQLADGNSAAGIFDDLVRLHQQRWNAIGKPGCFAARRFTDFHRAVALEGIESGRSVLARVSAGGRAIAVVYGFLTKNKFDVYQSGVEVDGGGPVASPGVAAHLLLMEALAGRGVGTYDFLRGSCQYKNSLSTDKTPLFSVRAWRPSIRALAHRSWRFLGLTEQKNPAEPQQTPQPQQPQVA